METSDRTANWSEIWDSLVVVVVLVVVLIVHIKCMVYLWPGKVHGHFGVIWCIDDFS